MNFKACCGLLAGSKDNEDYDYDDVEDPLPEPQTAAYVQRKVCYDLAARTVLQKTATKQLPAHLLRRKNVPLLFRRCIISQQQHNRT